MGVQRCYRDALGHSVDLTFLPLRATISPRAARRGNNAKTPRAATTRWRCCVWQNSTENACCGRRCGGPYEGLTPGVCDAAICCIPASATATARHVTYDLLHLVCARRLLPYRHLAAPAHRTTFLAACRYWLNAYTATYRLPRLPLSAQCLPSLAARYSIRTQLYDASEYFTAWRQTHCPRGQQPRRRQQA